MPQMCVCACPCVCVFVPVQACKCLCVCLLLTVLRHISAHSFRSPAAGGADLEHLAKQEIPTPHGMLPALPPDPAVRALNVHVFCCLCYRCDFVGIYM